jgi:hypothetical protein
LHFYLLVIVDEWVEDKKREIKLQLTFVDEWLLGEWLMPKASLWDWLLVS